VPKRAPAARREPVLLELSRAQVERVLHEVSAVRDVSQLLTGVPDLAGVLALAREQPQAARFSQSLLLGLALFAALPADGSYVGITELARELGVSASTAHRYVSTLVAVGLVERDPNTREYRLGHAR
jgi:IclR helix-turn-helix domain